ncbi:apolipoprotein N-acyltransferase [uncultured Hymenobacter sp.]|uniref:apolipoprotein N-acyltransferase n=1 Tax=uncultured Hymenobacter sp. TaxID=170016 RepID=UPI0035CA876B
MNLKTTTLPTSQPTTNSSLLTRHPWLLAVLGAVLLWAGWPVNPGPAPLLLFVGFVPYLLLERQLTAQGASRRRVFGHTYLFLVLWNAFTTWWVSYSTLGGGIAAVVLNALLMCLPLMAFRRTKARLGARWGYLPLPLYWIAFEQLHLHWDLTWPWLTLGNGFAAVPQWVQWYEFTGFLGGSVWIWAVNLAVFFALVKSEKLKVKPANAGLPSGSAGRAGAAGSGLSGDDRAITNRPVLTFSSQLLTFLPPLLLITLPIAFSYLLGASYQERGPAAEVLVIQPNVDPFEEKFKKGTRYIPPAEQLNRLLTRTEQNLTPQTRLVLWPETCLPDTQWEASFNQDPRNQPIRELLARHPSLSLLTGATSIITYSTQDAASATARYRDDLGYYDVFNSGVFLADATTPAVFYHKSRLVPGVEKIPPLLTSVIKHIDLGGTVGSYGSQEARTVFPALPSVPALRLSPIICYESVYGDFVSEYARNGATLLGIITNDGWWSDSPGYRQHLLYGALRAIETRRDIARSANTGISGFINQKGEITQRTGWWVGAASRGIVHLNDELTFYVRYGELLGRGAQVLAVLLLGLTIFNAKFKRSEN